MVKHVANPVPGVYYSLETHGEPPEGVEVLWGPADRVQSFSSVRFNGDTHWMLAPEPAPEPVGPKRPVVVSVNDEPIQDHHHYKEYVDAPSRERMEEVRSASSYRVETPPFPLSREEWDEAATGPGVLGSLHAKNVAVAQWWFSRPAILDYDTVVAAWRAAGCPGAEAPEGAAEEGSWRLERSAVWRGKDIVVDTSLAHLEGDEWKALADIVSDANDAHRLRGELEKAQAEVEAEREARKEAQRHHSAAIRMCERAGEQLIELEAKLKARDKTARKRARARDRWKAEAERLRAEVERMAGEQPAEVVDPKRLAKKLGGSPDHREGR